MLRRVLTLVMLVMLIALLSASVNAQGGGNRAALVVRYGDGSVQTKCVSFAETCDLRRGVAQTFGHRRTDAWTTASVWGRAVCSISGYGCAYPTQDCFCKCQGLSVRVSGLTTYWNGRGMAVFAGGRQRPSGEERRAGGLVVGARELQLRHDPAARS